MTPRIRNATQDDWPVIWSIVREVVVAADTFPYDPELSEHEGRAMWMVASPGRTTVAVDGAEVVGTAKFGGKRCYKVRLVRKSGAELIEYYDVATKLRVGSERKTKTEEGPVTLTTVILEYKTFGKVKHMSKFKQTMPGTEMITEVTSVEQNKVEDKVFALPAAIKKLKKDDF